MKYMQESSLNSIKTGRFTGHTSLLFWTESKIPVLIITAARNQSVRFSSQISYQTKMSR